MPGVTSNEGPEDDWPAIREKMLAHDNDARWTIPAVAACYWVGEAMHHTDFKDLAHRPRMVSETARMVVGNAAHLAGLLNGSPYPG